MNASPQQVHTAIGGALVASFGSGAGTGGVHARAAGPGGRKAAPAGAVRSLRSTARAQAARPGPGKKARQAILREIDAMGNKRPSSRKILQMRQRMAALSG